MTHVAGKPRCPGEISGVLPVETTLVEAESQRAWQFFRLLTEFPTFPLQAFPDVRPSLQLATLEGVALTGPQLVEILEIIRLSRNLGSFLQRVPEGYTSFADLSARLTAFPEIEDSLNRCLTSEGHLTDEASPELRMLRDRRRSLTGEIEHRLRQVVYTPVVTRRDRRPLCDAAQPADLIQQPIPVVSWLQMRVVFA